MGVLKDFNLQTYIDKFKTEAFIETGTGTGTGVQYAMSFPFQSIDSCEIDEIQAKHLSQRFAYDPRVTIWPKESSAFLTEVLSKASPNMPMLFFLDAHFPGADLGKAEFDAEKNIDVRLPLEKEVELISMFRPNMKDVIIIDDLRIYEKGPFQGGNMGDYGVEHCAKYIGLDFVEKIFQNSHTFEKLYKDSGYLILQPK
jgi:hypothetical protein